jgi:hypothetical protein
MTTTEATAARARDGRQPIDIGWLLVKPLDKPDREAARQSAERCREYLAEVLPGFDWQITLIGPRDFGIVRRASIVGTLEQGALERDVRSWDFVFVVTGADLETHYKSYAFAATARSLSAAVISTFRIDPEFSDTETSEAARTRKMAGRIRALFLQTMLLLNGVPRSEASRSLDTPRGLDGDSNWTSDQIESMGEALEPVADVRVEEQSTEPIPTVRFYLDTIRANPRAILGAVKQSNPWLLPIRLSRLMGAAFSALVILLITAEVWELGLTRSVTEVVVASGLSWLGTTIYVLQRQLLGLRRSGVRLIEHTVQNRVATTVVIGIGMFVAYLLLFSVSFVLGLALFDAELLSSWAPSLHGQVDLGARAALSGTVAAMGLVVGALGASFERQDYFRHVAEVDEEL